MTTLTDPRKLIFAMTPEERKELYRYTCEVYWNTYDELDEETQNILDQYVIDPYANSGHISRSSDRSDNLGIKKFNDLRQKKTR